MLFIPLTWISADGRTSDHNSLKTCSVYPPLHSQCFVFVYIFGKKKSGDVVSTNSVLGPELSAILSRPELAHSQTAPSRMYAGNADNVNSFKKN